MASENQPADILTNPLSGPKLEDLIDRTAIMGVCSDSEHTAMHSAKTMKAGFVQSATLLMALVMISPGDGTVLFEPHDPLVWLKLEEGVQIGNRRTTVFHLPRSICMVHEKGSMDSHLDVMRIMFSNLKEQCQALYESEVKPAVKSFAICQKPAQEMHKTRKMLALLNG